MRDGIIQVRTNLVTTCIAVNGSNKFIVFIHRVEPSGVVVARLLPYDVNIMGYNIPAEVTSTYTLHYRGGSRNFIMGGARVSWSHTQAYNLNCTHNTFCRLL